MVEQTVERRSAKSKIRNLNLISVKYVQLGATRPIACLLLRRGVARVPEPMSPVS